MKTKTILLTLTAACLTREYSNAASIVSAALWVTIADGGYPSTPVTVADGAFPPEFMTLGRYQGFAGGQMTIRLAEGEEVISAGYRMTTITPYNGGGYDTSTFTRSFSLRGVFPQYGSQLGDQLWAVTPPQWWPFNTQQYFGYLEWRTDFSYVFVVETNLGTFENGSNSGEYLGRYGSIPEPGVVTIALPAFLSVLRKRRLTTMLCS